MAPAVRTREKLIEEGSCGLGFVYNQGHVGSSQRCLVVQDRRGRNKITPSFGRLGFFISKITSFQVMYLDDKEE